MLRYATLKKRPKDLLALTGLARKEIDELLPVFEQILAESHQPRKRRKRAPGAGRKPILPTVADKLIFILVYMKTYPLQTVQAHLFGMSQQSANRYILRLLPVLAFDPRIVGRLDRHSSLLKVRVPAIQLAGPRPG